MVINQSPDYREKHTYKPWFNDELVRLHRSYIKSLDQFNKRRSNYSRMRLTYAKRRYKQLECRRRNNFKII